MNVGFSTGYYESFWGQWPWVPMYGGSERIVVECAASLASQGHRVSVRLPWDAGERVWRGVRWRGLHARPESYDILFSLDDFRPRDNGVRTVLVACRSDPPVHTDFDELVFLSAHHARLMGHPGRPFVGGGVEPGDYTTPKKRIARRVICTSSPDRCPAASRIGGPFDFRHSYRPVNGVGQELDREGLIDLQQTAQVQIYPLDPRRPSDFFSMSVLEAHAAGTPVVVSDADSMPGLWGESALVLPRPIDYGAWYEAIEDLLTNPWRWGRWSLRGIERAKELTWHKQSQRLLAIASA